MKEEELKALVVDALEDRKGVDIKVLDVHRKSSFTDILIICSGNSTRQVKALADSVVEKVKHAGVQPLGVEGEDSANWILVDLGDVVVHIMLNETRDYYNLEKLWGEQSPSGEE